MIKKISAIILVLSLCLQLCPMILVSADEGTTGPEQLQVIGNRLYTLSGEKIKLIGTCICSMEWAGGENMERSFAMSLDNWNSNTIRLPLDADGWWGRYWWISDGGASYQQKVRNLVDMATSRGKYVILDLHHFGWLKDEDVKWWDEVAPMFANNPGVMYNLFNEPHTTGWELWRNGGYRNGERVVGHQELLERIRAKGIKNIIVAGGMDWSYQLYSMVPGYDGLEYGYQLLEPDENPGYGIVYDTHIYPWKGGEDSWAKMVGVAFPYVPVFSGENGHTNERLADWFDDTYYEYATIWNNQLLNYYEQNEVNYNAWCFHNSSAPAALRNFDNYEPTPYDGLIVKFWLTYVEENNMPPLEEREVEDTKPVYTWTNELDFDTYKVSPLIYKETEDTFIAAESRPDGPDGSNCQLIAFDIPAGQENKAAAMFEMPQDWDNSGATFFTFRWKGDGDMRDMTFGVELNDGRQFSTTYPINLNKNWQRQFYHINALKGPYGLLDPNEIKYFYISPATAGPGSISIDDIVIGGIDPVEVEPKTYIDTCETKLTSWAAWADNENTRTDSFTVVNEVGSGVDGTAAYKFSFVRPEGSYGGQARGVLSSNWNLTDINYFSFDIRGDGNTHNLKFRLDQRRVGDQKSNFYKREFERFAYDYELTGSDWHHVVIRMTDFGMAETFEFEKLGKLQVYNMDPESSGVFYIDNLAFHTEYDLGLEDHYVMHSAPVASPMIEDIPYEYEDNIIYQFCNEEEGIAAVGGKADDAQVGSIDADATGRVTLTAGTKNYLHFTLRNKTDEKVEGLLTIEGLPDGTIFEENGQYVPYTVVWRQENSVYFAFTPPSTAKGEYKIRVLDTYAKGVEPREYIVNIE